MIRRHSSPMKDVREVAGTRSDGQKDGQNDGQTVTHMDGRGPFL